MVDVKKKLNGMFEGRNENLKLMMDMVRYNKDEVSVMTAIKQTALSMARFDGDKAKFDNECENLYNLGMENINIIVTVYAVDYLIHSYGKSFVEPGYELSADEKNNPAKIRESELHTSWELYIDETIWETLNKRLAYYNNGLKSFKQIKDTVDDIMINRIINNVDYYDYDNAKIEVLNGYYQTDLWIDDTMIATFGDVIGYVNEWLDEQPKDYTITSDDINMLVEENIQWIEQLYTDNDTDDYKKMFFVEDATQYLNDNMFDLIRIELAKYIINTFHIELEDQDNIGATVYYDTKKHTYKLDGISALWTNMKNNLIDITTINIEHLNTLVAALCSANKNITYANFNFNTLCVDENVKYALI